MNKLLHPRREYQWGEGGVKRKMSLIPLQNDGVTYSTHFKTAVYYHMGSEEEITLNNNKDLFQNPAWLVFS